MDIILYCSLQNTTLIYSKEELKSDIKKTYSPFYPLSIKLVMTDHVSHYIINPTNAYFDSMTEFSKIFYFITPNIITICHLCVSIISAKFVTSESLRDRRIGVILYEIRTWLDGFDGTVYRSQSGNMIYRSDRHTFGYYMDMICDTMGGVMLNVAVWFYLCKCPPVKKPEGLPWKDPGENGIAVTSGTEKGNGKPSNKYLFWKCWCFGVSIALSSMIWDRTVDRYTSVFQLKMQDSHKTELQTQYLHATSTWVVMWLWRILEGQALLQMLLISIFIDKIWEFINIMQYLSYVLIAALGILSEIHIRHVREIIGM